MHGIRLALREGVRVAALGRSKAVGKVNRGKSYEKREPQIDCDTRSDASDAEHRMRV